MLFKEGLWLISAAGVMNGSFVVPSRYMRKLSSTQAWFWHSIIGLIVIPWVLLLLLFPETMKSYSQLSLANLVFLLLSGAVFGVGQICFAYAIETIGVALSFAINLGLGVTIGSFYVALYHFPVLTSQNSFIFLAVLLIVAALTLYYFAAKGREVSLKQSRANYQQGWLFAIFTGMTSGLQNIAFVTTAFHSGAEAKLDNSFWVWPLFLTAAAVPMVIGFGYKIRKARLEAKTCGLRTSNSITPPESHLVWSSSLNLLLVVLMGGFFTGSLVLYSHGMSVLLDGQKALGWPLFMVLIILVSQFWGWLYREYRHIGTMGQTKVMASIGLLILAIVCLAAN